MITHALPILYVLASILFVIERLYPAHPLKPQTHWYIRAILINALQLFVFFVVDKVLNQWYSVFSLFNVSDSLSPFTGAFYLYVYGVLVASVTPQCSFLLEILSSASS